MKLAFLDSGYGLIPAYRYLLEHQINHECYFFMLDEFPVGNLKTLSSLKMMQIAFVFWIIT